MSFAASLRRADAFLIYHECNLYFGWFKPLQGAKDLSDDHAALYSLSRIYGLYQRCDRNDSWGRSFVASDQVHRGLGDRSAFDCDFTAPYLYDPESEKLVKDSNLGFMVTTADAGHFNIVGLFIHLKKT